MSALLIVAAYLRGDRATAALVDVRFESAVGAR